MNDFFQDIKPLSRRPKDPENSYSYLQSQVSANTFSGNKKLKRKSNGFLWVLATLSVCALLFILSFLFTRAEIVITPKTTSGRFEETLSFQKQGTNPNPFPFEFITVEDSITKEVSTTDKIENFEQKAEGAVTLFNYLTVSTKILQNSILETPDGKQFRLINTIIIPKAIIKSGKTTPGSIVTTVRADQSGEEYNIKQTDFTFSAFKGSSKYTKIFGRSSSVFSGGAKGTFFTISDEALSIIEEDMKNQLKEKLFNEALVQVPKEYVSFKNASFFASTTNTGEKILSKEEKSTIVVSGTFKMVIFPYDGISSYIIKKIAGNDVLTTDVSLSDLSQLDVVVENYDTTIGIPKDTTSIQLSFSGTPTVTWNVNEDAVKDSLLGKVKGDFNARMSSFSTTVDKAELVLKPFWVNRIPENKSKVHTTLMKPE